MMRATETAAYFKILGSLLYNEPGGEIDDMISENGFFEELPYAMDNELARNGQAQIIKWFSDADKERRTQEARQDYMRLFVRAGKVLAPPWGSVYLDEDRLLFSEDTLKVRQFYEKHGMMLKKKYKEPDAHIGLELEFIAYLLDNSDIDVAKTFVGEYMLPWVFKWNGDTLHHAHTDYYRGIANMAVGGVQHLLPAVWV